jgi:hypothetical protein
MDWNRAHSSPAPAVPAAPTLLEVCWRIRTPNNKVVTCAIVSDEAPGLDVRAFFTEDDLLRSHRAAELADAREIAERWKLAVLLKRGFVEIVDEGKGAM